MAKSSSSFAVFPVIFPSGVSRNDFNCVARSSRIESYDGNVAPALNDSPTVAPRLTKNRRASKRIVYRF